MKEKLRETLVIFRTRLLKQKQFGDFAEDDPTGAKLDLVIKAIELAICVAPET